MVAPGDHNGVVVLGPTAAGKTGLGIYLAGAFGGEIISADSRQVYRGLDLGSGKDLAEYGETPYHLIDIADLSVEYSVFDFQRDFRTAFDGVTRRGRLPVVVGGTGMYLDSVIRGYALEEVPVNDILRSSLEPLSLAELAERLLSLKKDVHNRTDLLEKSRLVRAIEIAEYKRDQAQSAVEIRLKPLVIGVRFDRTVLRQRIRTRLIERIEAGLVDEVRALHDAGSSWERLERLGLEYRFTSQYIEGKIPSKTEYIESLYTAICQFAKRQETWFRGMERKGVNIEWIENGNREIAEKMVRRFFEPARLP
jgi:tRNA dimethylallyltransferase